MLHPLSLSLSSSSHHPSPSRSISANHNPKSTAYYLKFRTTYRENLRHLKILCIIEPQTKPNNQTKHSPSRSRSISANPNPKSTAYYLKFRTTYRENLRDLKILGIVDPETKPNNLPLPDAVDHILVTVNFLRSKGFSDADFPRLVFFCPRLFSDTFQFTDIEPVFDFLLNELPTTVEGSRAIILECPNILFSDVELCLRPTLRFLRQIGVENLHRPTRLNARLLNKRVEGLRKKITFLQSIGFTYEESTKTCARFPAIFGYGLENNLMPKFEYLVKQMNRSEEELKAFPQYFGFSLEKRIIPRHLHLAERNVQLPLRKMLVRGDEKFYAEWK